MSVLKILLLEDSESDAALIARQLKKADVRFEARRVETSAAFSEELREWKPDIVLADYSLPSFDGLAGLQEVRHLDPDLPVIFVSGAISEDRAIEAVREGASDYVYKDRLARLASAVARAMEGVEERRKRRQAEEALRQSEQRYRQLVELSPDAIIVHRDLEILFANSSASLLLATPLEDMLGRPILDFIDPAYRSLALKRYAQLSEAQVSPHVEMQCLRSDGTKLQVEWMSVLIGFEEQSSVLSIARDISERKRLEKEILEISGREQRRIGQDLHDNLGQNLAGAAYLAKALEQKLEKDQSLHVEEAQKVVTLVTQSISQARALSRGLCPVDMVQEGLQVALRELAVNTREFFGIACSFQSSTPTRFDETTSNHLYHIALESVNNAAKHSGASRISILLEGLNGCDRLIIRDNGRGFTDEEEGSRGLGLRILAYRAKVIGASLDISSSPGAGTTVTCTLRH
jgi:two-component system, NarL family, sensor histidine kinase UhpB